MLSRLRRALWVRRVVRSLGVHRLQTALGAVQLPLRACVGVVVRRVPRDPALVVLGSPLDRFADNAAYLFLHLAGDADGPLSAVWVTGSRDLVDRLRSLGYRAELRWSRAGVGTCLRAGTYAYSGYRSDINRWLSTGAFALCLWHGIPIKRIELDAGPATARDGLRGRLSRLARDDPPDALLSSTEHVSRRFMAPAFGIPVDRCWPFGYPRNDHLVRAPEAGPPAALVPDRRWWDELSGRRPVVGLFLTWRDQRATDLADEDLVARIADVCGRRGAVLAYKAHFNVAAAQVASDDCVLLPPDADLNSYLGLCDVLVTDYSSVSIDFVLMHRPVVYYMPDLDDYARTRGFYLDPLTLPGTVTRDADALLEAIDRQLSAAGPAVPDADLEAFLRSTWGDYDGRAAAGIAAALAERARQPGRPG